MELPISPVSYQPAPDALVRAIHQAAITLARTVTAEEEIAGSVVFAHADRPDVRAVNFAASVSLLSGEKPIEKVQSILGHFSKEGATCHVMLPAQTRCDPPLEEAILANGYQRVERQVLSLAGYQPVARQNAQLQMVPARSLYSQLDGFYQSMARKEHHADARLARDFAATMIDFLDEPRLEVFVARLQGAIVAAGGVLAAGDIGVIMPAWTDPDHRGRGIARELMTHLLDHASRSLFKQVILDRSVGCPAIPFYESLGFSQVASYVKYRRPSGG